MNNSFTTGKALLINKSARDSRELESALLQHCPEADIVKVRDTKDSLNILKRHIIDSVFIDYVLSREGDFIGELQRENILLPVVVIVEKGKELQAAEAIKQGAYDYIMKGSDYNESIPRVLERIESMSILLKEDEKEQQSVIFKQIYRSQKWWQNIIDAITDYLFVIDQNYRILRTNKAFADLFGKEPQDIIMKPYYTLFDMDEPHEWCQLPESGDHASARSVERSLNDMVYLISCFPTYFDDKDATVYILKDITETRRLKDQVYHLDKLSSLGTLTSGVAHEINNPLTGIIGYTEMLLMKSKEGTTKKYLQNVYDSAIRCKRIVENMLTFSRQNPSQRSPENINEIIDKTIELHEYWLKSTNIEIIKNYSTMPSVAVDRQQLQQVVLNLLINAEQAISEKDSKGTIEFDTLYDTESKTIVVTVSDNGMGIPQDILPKIFDPFFTTKPVNKGTGLGLSIAHGIVAEQGGIIEAASVTGEGTSFTIKLPG